MGAGDGEYVAVEGECVMISFVCMCFCDTPGRRDWIKCVLYDRCEDGVYRVYD